MRPQRNQTGCHIIIHDIAEVDAAKMPGTVRSFIANEGHKAYQPAAIKHATKHAFIDPVTNQSLFGTEHLPSIKLRKLSEFSGFDRLPFSLQKRVAYEINAAEKRWTREDSSGDENYTNHLFYGDGKTCDCVFTL